MKPTKLLVSLLSVVFAASAIAGTPDKTPAPVQPPAEDTGLGATVTIGYDTDYVFRGVEFARNLVSGSLDWVVPIVKDSLSLDLNAWYGASAGDSAELFAGGGSYGELDLAATLGYKVGPVTLGLKYTWYDYVGNAGKFVKDINEVGITAATSVVGLDLAAGVYHDWTAEGWYYEAAVSHTFKITETISVVPGVLVSFASHYYGVDGGNTVKPSLAVPIKLSKSATLTPYVAGNLPFGSLNSLGEQSRIYGGIALSVTF